MKGQFLKNQNTMNNLQKLNYAQEQVQNEFLSAEGDEWSADEWSEEAYADDDDEYADEWDEEAYADDDEYADDWVGADDEDEYEDARGRRRRRPTRPMQKSPPFIIQIVNAATSAISNVDVGDSYTQRTVSNFGQNSNITITSTISGVTYIEFLAESESRPFKVGRTMIISSSTGQLDQTIAITHRNGRGDRVDHIISPTKDPNQNQDDRVIDDYQFQFDGYTRLRFNQINASATVTIRLYPVGIFSATKIVSRESGNIRFKAPRLVRTMQVQTPRRARRSRRVRRIGRKR